MFRGLASKLGLGRNPPEPPLLRDALHVLRALDETTWRTALAYVSEGTAAESLARWAQSGDDTAWRYLGMPGTLQPRWSTALAADDAAIAQALPGWSVAKARDARSALYAGIPALGSEQIVRFARLLNAVAGSAPLVSTSPATPDWLARLLVDVFWPVGGRGPRAANLTDRRFWHPVLLIRLLQADGMDPDGAVRVVLATMFDRHGMQRDYSGVPLPRLYEMHALSDFALAFSDELAALVPGFGVEGRRGLIAFLNGRPELTTALLPALAALAVDPAKGVRGDALTSIAVLPPEAQVNALEPLVSTAAPGRIADVVDSLARIPSGLGLDALRRALVSDPTGKRAEIIGAALERGAALQTPMPQTPRPPFAVIEEADVDPGFVARARGFVDDAVRANRIGLKEIKAAKQTTWTASNKKNVADRIARLEAVSDRDITAAAAYLSGTSRQPPKNFDDFTMGLLNDLNRGLTLLQYLRLSTRPGNRVVWPRVRHSVGLDFDLRTIADALARAGHDDPVGEVARLVFSRWNYDLGEIDPALVWPFLDEYPEPVEVAFGLRPDDSRGSGSYGIDRAFELLAVMPAIPGPILSRLGEIALGTGKSHRLAAQTLLEQHDGALTLAAQGLGSAKLEVRETSAQWLARIADPASIALLRTALAKEKREVVKSAILTALETLGDDISADVAPETLIAEATTSRIATPAALSWFPFDALPEARWAATGTPVPPEVLRWWVILAVKLKDPGGAGMVARYVGLLDDRSAAALGEFVADGWIAEDTRRPSDAESRAHAAVAGPARHAEYQRLAAKYPQYPDYYGALAAASLDEVVEQCRREHSATYPGSAIASKGLLALTVGARGHRLVRQVQAYMRDHYTRRAQVEALIAAIAANDDPAALQLLLGVARRHRTASVQGKARALVEQLAERRGWTADQLADRTVPTAGFGDDGILRLSYGEREFTARITPAFTLELSNDSGKVVRALPAKRESEDADTVKDAKSQLTASRAELKLVVAMQTQRLYEAMCAGRSWPAAEWSEFLAGHPIVSRLITGLVWIECVGEKRRLLRLGDDGSPIGVDDDDVVLDEAGELMLAHSALVGAEASAAWRAHLSDYGATPLFPQFDSETPVVVAASTEIADRRGWVSDAFGIRAAATKRGYQRGASEDGGWFTEYTKDFAAVHLQVVVGFSGNGFPEENIAAATTTLTVRALRGGHGVGKDLPLDSLPPVLVAEAYTDYLGIAGAGVFDPDWEKRTAW